jgi:uncharacterized transporter YbjL
MEILHAFFHKSPIIALFLSLAIGYGIGNIKFGNFQLGGLAGLLTCTTGLNAVVVQAESETPVLGYTVPYAIANVLLTLLGPVIVLTA